MCSYGEGVESPGKERAVTAQTEKEVVEVHPPLHAAALRGVLIQEMDANPRASCCPKQQRCLFPSPGLLSLRCKPPAARRHSSAAGSQHVQTKGPDVSGHTWPAASRGAAAAPTSLIRAPRPPTAPTLIASQPRLYGKVIQLSPGSQRVLKK